MKVRLERSGVLSVLALSLLVLAWPSQAEDYSACYVCGVDDGYASCIGHNIPNFSTRSCQTTCIWGLAGKVCFCRTFGLQCSAAPPGEFLVGRGATTGDFVAGDQVSEALKQNVDPVLVDLAVWPLPAEAVAFGRGPQPVNGTFSVGTSSFYYSGEATLSKEGLSVRYEFDGYPGAQAIEMHMTRSHVALVVERPGGEPQRVTVSR